MARLKMAVAVMALLLIGVHVALGYRSLEARAGNGHTAAPRLTSPIIDLDPRHNRTVDGASCGPTSYFPLENNLIRSGLGTAASAPGLQVATTAYEYQSNDAVPHQIACNGGGPYVHMSWTQWGVISESLNCGSRTANFRTYSSATGTFVYSTDGVSLSGTPCDWLFGGSTSMDIDNQDRAVVAFNQFVPPRPLPVDDYSSWFVRQTDPGLATFTKDSLRGSEGTPASYDGLIWPHVTVDQMLGVEDVIHVVAHSYSNSAIVYWRFKTTDVPQWQGPIVLDSSMPVSYNIAADRTSDKAALITTHEWITAGNPYGLRQVTYRESPDNGLSWINGTGLGDAHRVFITNYDDPAGSASWFECVGDYDNGGKLHVIWNEKRYGKDSTSAQCAWKHWDGSSDAISTIYVAYYDNPAIGGRRRLNIGLPSIGFGDGSTLCNGSPNLNYVYMTFVQFGGPTATQQNDVSARGFMNGDIYMSISGDGGLLWGPAVNLTHSSSPGCDPSIHDSCQSENWPSIARTVNDTLHLMYIADRDAGDAVFGEGTWTLNPVLYYRIPGATDGALCPEIAPVLEYILTDTTIAASQKTVATSITKNLKIDNYGNALLSGNVTVVYMNPPTPPVNWLTVGGAQTQSYSVVAGTPGIKWLVVASNLGLDTGVYHAELRITHNDPHRPTPQVLSLQMAGPPCVCPSQGDVKPDGVIDVFDVIGEIGIAFSGDPDPKDPQCPKTRGDVDNNGVTDVFDVIYLIATAFSGGPDPVNPCGP